MPHISRHKLKKEISERIYKELLEHVTNKGLEWERKRLYANLMTRTEKIMFSKRLAIICMLGEGYTFEDIQELLRVSPSTVGRLLHGMQKGRYTYILKIVRRRKFIEEILAPIRAILPRSYYAPRWAWLDKTK